MSSFERLRSDTSVIAVPTPAAWRGRRYDDDRLHLLARDPRRLFATWEISAPLAARAELLAAAAGAAIRYQLRVERQWPGRGSAIETLAHDLPDARGGEAWYIDLPTSGGTARALLGLDLPSGFRTLLASRWIDVPPDGPCDEEGAWPGFDADAEAWLAREAERQRAAGARAPSSAARFLAAPPPAKG